MNINRWTTLNERLSLKADANTFNALESAYSESHRAYHTAVHIDACLSNLDAYQHLFENPDSVEMALWFHDAIYQPFSSTNEEDSASWAAEYLKQAGAQEKLIDEVSQLILATKHDGQSHTNDALILVDIDLAILGAEADVYARFETDIRIEYKKVPKFIFRKKRAKLLQSFLLREHLYASEPFRERYEEKARVNLASAIQALLR